MLQIATGMYFPPGAALHETTHRTTVYTNGFRIDRDPVTLPFATLLFSTGIAAFTPVSLEVVDRLPATDAEGQSFGMIATGGEELTQDAAAVLAFATNTTWSTDRDLLRRLVPATLSDRPGHAPTSQLRRTFDPQVLLTDDAFADAAAFASTLLALDRTAYDKAIRAIHRVIDATLLIADDVTLAYTLYVAALESLAADTDAPPADWHSYDGRKRGLIDPALADLDPAQAERVRTAVLQADALGLARRFQAFTLDHVEASFYRAEAVGASRPITAASLPRALQFAYRVRSRQVHALEKLAPEMWAISQRSDTLPFDGQTVLSLEGLNRLCRHVIRRYVDRAPTGVDTRFDWWATLPGKVTLQMAPQYWIWKAPGLTIGDGPERLKGFLDLLLPALRGDEDAKLVPMHDVLAAIEKLLPAEAVPAKRAPMVALYRLWHSFLDPTAHRPGKDKVLARFGPDLDQPSASAFAVCVLLEEEPPWPTDQLAAFAAERQAQLRRGNAQALPDRMDATLQLCLARRLWRDGDRPAAARALGTAVETLPGDGWLLELEQTVRAHLDPNRDDDAEPGTVPPPMDTLAALDLRSFLLDVQDSASDTEDPVPADAEAAEDRQAGPGESAGTQ